MGCLFSFVIDDDFDHIFDSAPEQLAERVNRFQIDWFVRPERLHSPFRQNFRFPDFVGCVSCVPEFFDDIFVDDHGFSPFRNHYTLKSVDVNKLLCINF